MPADRKGRLQLLGQPAYTFTEVTFRLRPCKGTTLFRMSQSPCRQRNSCIQPPYTVNEVTLYRNQPFDGDPIEIANCLAIVVHRVMHGATIVPDDDISRLPLVAI